MTKKPKIKLINMRNSKGFTQKQVAEKMNMSESAYNKREKGKLRIDLKQWKQLANIHNCDILDIFEEDVKQIIICNDNATGNYWETQNNYNTPEAMLETYLKNYRVIIEEKIRLEIENSELKKLIKEKID